MLSDYFKKFWSFVPLRLREPKVFWDTLSFLREAQWWNAKKIAEYQFEAARRIIEHAWATTTGYRRLFEEHGVTPADFKSLEDIRRFPTVSKEDLRDRPEDFASRAIKPGRRVYTATGGATAIPFGFYWVRGLNIPVEKAFIFNLWERAGYRVGEKTAVLRGSFVGNPEKGELWRRNHLTRELLLSSYHLTAEKLPVILDEIRKFGPRFVQAYPSSATITAKYLQEHADIEPPKIQALFCGSETIYPGQREFLERYWRCRVLSWYGHTESAALGGECEKSSQYHLEPHYGFVELLDKEGRPVENPGDSGEITATGFYGLATPFIRYRTRDLGVWGQRSCGSCGRNYRLLERVMGRAQELAVAASGRAVSMTAINMHTPIFDHVRQFQFVQERAGFLTLRLVRKPQFSDADSQEILKAIGEKLGSDIALKLDFVESLETAPSGKGRFLIQKLPINTLLDKFEIGN